MFLGKRVPFVKDQPRRRWNIWQELCDRLRLIALELRQGLTHNDYSYVAEKRDREASAPQLTSRDAIGQGLGVDFSKVRRKA